VEARGSTISMLENLKRLFERYGIRTPKFFERRTVLSPQRGSGRWKFVIQMTQNKFFFQHAKEAMNTMLRKPTLGDIEK
jgi:hypothetical protein